MSEDPREACFLIGRGGAILWADASSSPYAMPDSRERWDAIWRLRDDLEEIAHSHPRGPLAFSSEDATTVEALTAALGRRLAFSVVAPNGMIRIVAGPVTTVTTVTTLTTVVDEPFWASLLRLVSRMEAEPR